MALPSPATGETVEATDITDIKDHLEGAVGSTAPYHFRQSSGNWKITLSTANGSTKLSLCDSGGVEVFSVDSDGNVTAAGSISQGTLIWPTSATPSQTTEGSGYWDTDDDLITMGTGSATKRFQPFDKGSDIASASSLTLANDQYYHVTGTTTITGMSTKPAGYMVVLEFDSPLTLTHNATSFILAGAQSRVVQAGDTVTFRSEGSGNWREVGNRNTLESLTRGFIQDGAYQSFFWVSSTYSQSVNNTPVGLGVVTFLDSSAGLITTVNGYTTAATGASSGNDAGVLGQRIPGGRGFVISATLVANNVASQSVFMGASAGSDFLDTNANLMGFRVNGTGNYIGVCDSGGTETTRDTSVVPDGSTFQRLTVRRSGSTVQFFRNGAQVGADVTSNLTSSNMIAMLGIQTTTSASKNVSYFDFNGMVAAA